MLSQGIKQTINLKQKQVLNAQMIQSLTFLQFSAMQINSEIEKQLSENIVLEKEEIEFAIPQKEVLVSDDITRAEEKNDFSTSDWIQHFENNGKGSNYKTRNEDYDELYDPDLKSNTKETLKNNLIVQANTFFYFDLDKEIAKLLIENIDSNGFLEREIFLEDSNEKESIFEYVVNAINDKYKEKKIDEEDVKEILSEIHGFYPIGCGAFSKLETLLIQARKLSLPDYIINIIENDLESLANRKTDYLKNKYKIGKKDIKLLLESIQKLEPIPGRNFFTEETKYIEPDLILYKEDNEYKVKVTRESVPNIRVNMRYLEQLKDPNLDEETKEYLTSKVRAAGELINALHLRKSTMLKVMETILELQKDFFYKGKEYLKPMTSKDIADILGYNESTISRVRSNKYVLTDFGVFKLGYFFSNTIKSSKGDLSSKTVKNYIKEEVEKEDKKKPLSDSKIQKIIKEKYSINITRRTVANYRTELGILSSSKRKEF